MAVDMIPCRIREGWDEAGRTGMLCVTLRLAKSIGSWSVVIWEGDDEPSLHKTAGIELSTTEWKSVGGVVEAPYVYFNE